MKNLIFLCFLTFSMGGFAQNKEILYDFDQLPQTLMLNPGAEIPYKMHIGMPLLSQISLQAGFTGFSAYDIFANNALSINQKINNAVANFGKTEFAAANEQIDIINAGFRLKNGSYLSVGLYSEFDLLAKIPKDLVTLFYEGNANFGKAYSIRKLNARGEALGVFHIGLSKKINKKLTVGGRAKLYSGVFNAVAKNTSGYIITENGVSNSYSQSIQNVYINAQTSGIFLDSNTNISAGYITQKMLLGGNIGLGLDAGFTYHINKQTTLTASMLDLGFIYNTKNVQSYKIKGNFTTEGISLNFDPLNPTSQAYWQNLKDDFNKNVVMATLYKSYVSFRPLKIYGSLSYGFGRPNYDDCRFYDKQQEPYNNKVGVQLFASPGAVHTYTALTLFYEKRLSKFLQTKLTYTADSFSFSNIGVGISSHIGVVNFYLAADNLLNLANLYAAKSAGVQLGINFIVNPTK